MKIEDWLRWPTNSSDPALNAAIAVLLAVVVITVIAAGAAFLIPVLIVIGLAKAVHRYVRRPTPTDQLYAQTKQRTIAANFPDTQAFLDRHIERFLDAIRDDPPARSIGAAMMEMSEALYAAEHLANPLPPLAASSEIEEGRYRDKLIAHQRKTADAPRTLEVINVAFGQAYLDFIAKLPPIARTTWQEFTESDEADQFATFPLIDMLPNAHELVWPLVAPFFADDVTELGLFAALRNQLDRNFHAASGTDFPAPSDKLVMPDQHKGTPREIVAAYLRATPLEALFHAPIPFAFADRHRFEHMHVIGGSGHGKTQFLQHLIAHGLTRERPPAMVVIDSQGEMLERIQRLDVFAPGGRLADRLIIIDPEDVGHPPALNMFDLKATRLGSYSDTVKEQIEASTIETFNYVFGALAAELTSRQTTTFAFVSRLMLSIQGATIHTLRELFEDGALAIEESPFADHIAALDQTSQAYFRNQFFTRAYTPTRQQIARRLYGVLQVPAFERMFAAPENRLDMFEAMQSGSVVLINTSKALLKTDASALFGRYMIARVITAAFERIALKDKDRNPAFLIVDEASEYFDENLETLLSQARKFNLGVVFAHQHLDQLTPALRSSVAANTSIKLAGGISDRDARALASDMRTTPDFIAGMTKHARSTEFACHVRNYTGGAVRLTIPFGTLETAPKMSADAHAALVAANRERTAVRPGEPRPTATVPARSAPTGAPAAATLNRRDDWRS